MYEATALEEENIGDVCLLESKSPNIQIEGIHNSSNHKSAHKQSSSNFLKEHQYPKSKQFKPATCRHLSLASHPTFSPPPVSDSNTLEQLESEINNIELGCTINPRNPLFRRGETLNRNNRFHFGETMHPFGIARGDPTGINPIITQGLDYEGMGINLCESLSPSHSLTSNPPKILNNSTNKTKVPFADNNWILNSAVYIYYLYIYIYILNLFL